MDELEERATLMAEIVAYFLPGEPELEELLALLDAEPGPLLEPLDREAPTPDAVAELFGG